MDQSPSNLQIPDNDWSQPGPSSSRNARAASAALAPAAQLQSAKKRASHSVTMSQRDQKEDAPAYRDVYAHPAAVAFAAAHPRRTIPKFGPYLLLQTLGEGEFGKVKLGLHGQWGEEVAVKLIRRGNVENPLRLSKVEREIEVLKLLKHPNIVRLYDVIETDKYIGIILEYASGGELFDHILAHRYLKEKDACKLFAQLISGVSYIHSKKIVHRDLKLENLLLDRSRNVIITDFGFANRFEHRSDDLMQTSCGSPCYAAPELVISEGLYVGSAVDIWSCGVILYAMLAGYLPFDDDPANPEGDNINLLYKYIVNTPLTFPDYVSTEARDLLSLMLVPDPKRRAGLKEIMAHSWLAPYASLFDRTVAELEKVAMEQQNLKRQAYQRQMRAHAEQQAQRASPAPTQYLYDSSAAQTTPAATPRRVVASAIVMGSSAEPEPFIDAPTPASTPAESARRTKSRDGSRGKQPVPKTPAKTPEKEKEKETGSSRRKKTGAYRHTIQLEYPEEVSQLPQPPMDIDEPEALSPTTPTQRDRRPPQQDPTPSPQTPKQHVPPTLEALFTPPSGQPTERVVKSHRPGSISSARKVDAASINGSTRSAGSRHHRGLSMDKFGFGKILGGGAVPSSDTEHVNNATSGRRASVAVGDVVAKTVEEKEKPEEKATDTDGKKTKSRRKTLSLMVEPISRTIKDRTKNRSVTVEVKKNKKDKEQEGSVQELEINPISPSAIPAALPTAPAGSSKSTAPSPFVPPTTNGVSTLSAKTVMNWFRLRSLGKRDAEPVFTPVEKPAAGPQLDSYPEPPVQVIVTNPQNQDQAHPERERDRDELRSPVASRQRPPSSSRASASRTPSESGGRSFVNLVRTVTAPKTKFDATSLRIHHGAVDQATITSGAPPVVFAHVTKVLQGMGLEIQRDSEFKYRCIRPKKGGYAAVALMGSAASNGIDKRGLPVPSQLSSAAGGMLRGLLMRRQSSQVSSSAASVVPAVASTSFDTEGDSSLMSEVPEGTAASEAIYGDRSVDQGDEVRFSVELTRIDRLEDTLSLDIRRLKGNLRSYKFLYDTLREWVVFVFVAFGFDTHFLFSFLCDRRCEFAR
ncbi:Pkinase-domain-containing protein [Hysterangium stoloniferum]|nr:Pkinase-domain-containing protein [Hysterangium stoloniferum]